MKVGEKGPLSWQVSVYLIKEFTTGDQPQEIELATQMAYVGIGTIISVGFVFFLIIVSASLLKKRYMMAERMCLFSCTFMKRQILQFRSLSKVLIATLQRDEKNKRSKSFICSYFSSPWSKNGNLFLDTLTQVGWVGGWEILSTISCKNFHVNLCSCSA